MKKLETALDDLDGLLEAYRALAADDANAAAQDADDLKRLEREIAGAADAYAVTLVASAGGEVTARRIAKCRVKAEAAMAEAVKRQSALASAVHARRLPAPALREDLRQLLTLSLQCRAALAALEASAGINKKEIEALANKVLVELREATLLYLARARDSGDVDGVKARAAVAALLEKTEPHAAALARIEQDIADREGRAHNVLAKDVTALLHKTAHEWGLAAERSEAAAAP